VGVVPGPLGAADAGRADLRGRAPRRPVQPIGRDQPAAALADADGPWDVGVVIDADVFHPIPHVRAAIESAAAGKVTWAHRRWRNVAERHLKRLLADPDTFGPVPAEARDMDLLVDVTTPISWSCCVAVPRATFDDMGGFDERFRGWGFEDGAWAALVRAMYPWARIDGDMYHLDHPRSDERIILGESRSTASSDYVRNALLGRRYMVAAIRDHAAGDQTGEEHLPPDLVKVHVANLTNDDKKFLAMAKERGMPEAAGRPGGRRSSSCATGRRPTAPSRRARSPWWSRPAATRRPGRSGRPTFGRRSPRSTSA
jgi:hypothetical protein